MKPKISPDQLFMRRCFELAKKGLGYTYPNPLVGSVIVHNNQIIGEGWHQKAGEAHAEINAINSVKNKALLAESTLYVNLEPCNHIGRTPPCSLRIVKEGIPRVIVGCIDPFEKVNGGGIMTLNQAGTETTLNVLQNEARHLNRRFFTYHQKKRPYIILKWAESQDGYIAPTKAQRSKKAPVFLTQRPEQILVHQWRKEEQAILVGAQTVVDDNPSLTTRWVEGNNPFRLILDPNGRVDPKANVFDSKAPSLHLTHLELATTSMTPPQKQLLQLMDILYQKEISSVIIEGGKKTLDHFIQNDLWDEARVFKTPVILKEGIPAPLISGKEHYVETGNYQLILPPQTGR